MKKEIGRRISDARKEKGFTLKKLGEKAGGLSPTRIANWEHGLRTPGPLEVKQLAAALDISPAFLMGFTEEKENDSDIKPGVPMDDYYMEIYPVTPKIPSITIPWRLIHFLETLSEEKIDMIFDYIEKNILGK